MIRNIQKIKFLFTWDNVLCYLGNGFLIICLILGLIFKPIETLINVGILIAFIVGYGLIILLHENLKQKNKIDWNTNQEISELADGFCFGYSIFILLIVSDIINGFFDGLTIVYILFLIYSTWTYFSVILAKQNALLLMRTYLIFSLYALGYYLIGNISEPLKVIEPFEWIINFRIVEIIFTIGMYIILPSAIIKGIIIAYSKKCKEVYLNQKYRYSDVVMITILMIGILFFYNNNFTLV